MNRIKAVAAVLKFINGSNDKPDSLRNICGYTTAKSKTNDGELVLY